MKIFTGLHSFGLLKGILVVYLIALSTMSHSQSCGVGSCRITVGGSQISPFQTVCPNTTITYGVSGSPMSEPSWSIIPSNAGSFSAGISTGMSVSVTWLANGKLRMDYPDMSGSQCEEVNYTITTFSSGTIAVVGSSSVCSGANVTLRVSNTQNAGGLIWQQCTSGCASESNWITASGTVSGSDLNVTNLTTSTSYRTKLVNSTCGGGTLYSNQVTVSVTPTTTVRADASKF